MLAALFAYKLTCSRVKVTGSTGVIYIPKGTDYSGLQSILQKKHLIRWMFLFNLDAGLTGLKEQVKEGRYEFPAGTTYLQLARLLRSGLQSPVKLNIRKCRTKTEFARYIASRMEIDSAALLQTLNDEQPAARSAFAGLNTEQSLCLFIPNTYELYWNCGLSNFLLRMLQEYHAYWNSSRQAQARTLGLSTTEVYILASIVDEETAMEADKTPIAGVYINRLRKGMKLDADPTVKFAMGNFSLRRLYNKHLEYESPYNTYLHKGLPPGPICIPSLSSLEAVLRYADTTQQHDYLYFCASVDKPGYSVFASTLEEHRKNAKNYNDYLNDKNIH